jgi:hypothetical protein
MISPKETILDNDFATIWCYPKKGIIHHQLHKYFFGETFREILMTGLEAFENNACTKWLSDDRNFGAIFPDDKKWGDAVWRPRVLAAGWKFWAMVLPEKVTGQMNIKKMVAEYKELGLVTRVLSDPKEAMNWLLAQ